MEELINQKRKELIGNWFYNIKYNYPTLKPQCWHIGITAR